MPIDEAFVRAIEALKALVGLVPGKPKSAVHVFRMEKQDFTICETRVLREGRGWPWSRKVAGHRDRNGHFELIPWQAPKPAKPARSAKRVKKKK